jgi:hypothetical protein
MNINNTLQNNKTMERTLYIEHIKTDKHNITDIKYELVHVMDAPSDIKSFIKSKYSIKDNDVLYIDKSCTVPRFKLKEFCAEKNIKITRDITKATSIFISDDIIKEYFNYKSLEKIPAKDFVYALNKKCPYHTDAIKIKEIIESENLDFIVIGYYTYSNQLDIKIDYSSDSLLVIDDENYDKFKVILQSNAHHQNDLLKLLNNSVTMDADMYKQMSQMLNTNDNANIKLAMELLANCDYEASAVYILLIFKNYGTTMWDSGFRHHVNFKSLLKFFDFDGRYKVSRFDLDHIVNKLKSKNLMTDENLAILMPIAEQEIKEYNHFSYFKVKEIEFEEKEKEDENEDDEEIVNINDEEVIF